MKANTTINSLLIGALALGSFAPAMALTMEPALEARATFSNRYVTEGINNDPDSSGFSFLELTAEFEPITLGVWYAQSLRGSAYNEVNLFAEYGFVWEKLELFAGINFLTFPAPDDSNTWEFYIGGEYELLPWLTLFGQTYYDFDEVRGGFLELGASTVLPELGIDERLEISPYVLYGVDYGYVSGPRRLRSNNIQLGINADFEVQSNLVVFAGVHHSFRLSNLKNEDEGDVSWVEAGVSWRF